jgi:ketosteroid isomerase-like protein
VPLSVADRLDILGLLARVDTAVTHRDVDAYLQEFTDDAVLDGQVGDYRGNGAICEMVGPTWASERSESARLTLNVQLSPMPGDPRRVTASSLLMIVKLGSEPIIHSVSAIAQCAVKLEDRWQVEPRAVLPINPSAQ